MDRAIGVFDSGYGGLSVLRDIVERLPGYDYIYLGDNARAPYGGRSFERVHEFTLEAVEYLFDRGCPLVILACNTASAKALRTIQQNDLPRIAPDRRVLGVIRPTAEAVGEFSRTGRVGVFATQGTIASRSYDIEVKKLNPGFEVYGQPCPMWVPIVENLEMETPGAEYFIGRDVNRLLGQCADIDAIILGCTHYPLIYDQIRKAVPQGIRLIEQGRIVAESLADYLRRHPEMDARLSRGGGIEYLTTESPEKFDALGSIFMRRAVESRQIQL
ncbi:MAG: glutamate racemase [Lachnospiraceae bacterium]|nr:glutamate racemase [Lachnospiraceae bacterium]